MNNLLIYIYSGGEQDIIEWHAGAEQAYPLDRVRMKSTTELAKYMVQELYGATSNDGYLRAIHALKNIENSELVKKTFYCCNQPFSNGY